MKKCKRDPLNIENKVVKIRSILSGNGQNIIIYLLFIRYNY